MTPGKSRCRCGWRGGAGRSSPLPPPHSAWGVVEGRTPLMLCFEPVTTSDDNPRATAFKGFETEYAKNDWRPGRRLRPRTSPAPSSETAARDELAGNHIALDLIGTFTDNHQRRIPEIAFDVILGGVAVT